MTKQENYVCKYCDTNCQGQFRFQFTNILVCEDCCKKVFDSILKKDKVENSKWKPRAGDICYRLSPCGDINEITYWEVEINDRHEYKQGNIFRTREEAEAIRDLREDMQRYDVKVGDEIKYVIGRNLEIINADGYSTLGLTKVHEVIYQITFKTKEDAQRRADILNRLAKAKGLI